MRCWPLESVTQRSILMSRRRRGRRWRVVGEGAFLCVCDKWGDVGRREELGYSAPAGDFDKEGPRERENLVKIYDYYAFNSICCVTD